MRVLIDTNVCIERESTWQIPESLQNLEYHLRTQGHDILVHEQSKQEIRNYKNEDRREIVESKIATYAELRMPKYPTSSDTEFRAVVGEAETFNEQVDNALLYAVYSEQVDALVTEDKGIHGKAEQLGVADSVYTIEAGKEKFRDESTPVTSPPSIQRVNMRDLDVDDPIFDSLKEDYPEFEDWFARHPERDAYVNWNADRTIGAILILKIGELERIGPTTELGRRERVKISTLKVADRRRGTKTGEYLISIAIREALNHEINEVYLTHYERDVDYLVELIAKYGFTKVGEQPNGEGVFVKRLTPGLDDDPSPRDFHIRFYPSYYDGSEVDKFLVPIQPKFHSRLFVSYQDRQPKLREFQGQFYSEGNAIKKAYLCHANTKQLGSEDVLLFYRTKDHKTITSIGVCEQVGYDMQDPDEILEMVGRRSVFQEHEIRELAEKPTTVILFKWHFDLPTPIRYSYLRDENIVAGPIQTTQQIDHDDYVHIRQRGGIDERFTFH